MICKFRTLYYLQAFAVSSIKFANNHIHKYDLEAKFFFADLANLTSIWIVLNSTINSHSDMAKVYLSRNIQRLVDIIINFRMINRITH